MFSSCFHYDSDRFLIRTWFLLKTVLWKKIKIKAAINDWFWLIGYDIIIQLWVSDIWDDWISKYSIFTIVTRAHLTLVCFWKLISPEIMIWQFSSSFVAILHKLWMSSSKSSISHLYGLFSGGLKILKKV